MVFLVLHRIGTIEFRQGDRVRLITNLGKFIAVRGLKITRRLKVFAKIIIQSQIGSLMAEDECFP